MKLKKQFVNVFPILLSGFFVTNTVINFNTVKTSIAKIKLNILAMCFFEFLFLYLHFELNMQFPVIHVISLKKKIMKENI